MFLEATLYLHQKKMDPTSTFFEQITFSWNYQRPFVYFKETG